MYNTKEEFLVAFQEWRKNCNYPKRDECREMFKYYKNLSLLNVSPLEQIEDIPVFDYILSQDKPGTFLDSLFRKENSVCQNDPKPEKIQENKKTDEDYKLEIINAFYAYVQENKSVPSFKILNSQLGYKCQKYFQDEKDLYYACATVYDIQEYLLNEADFSPEYTRETLKLIKKYKRFMVTTAVAGKKVNKLLLKSMLNYAERKDALILVLPSQDVFNRKSKFEFELDPELKNDKIRIIYEDTYLNSNIYLSDIKVSAKAVYPLSGLDGLCLNGTTIVGSVKQDCKAIPAFPDKTPNFILGTGAVTEPDFSNDAYMSNRLNKLASETFVSGGIIVEIENKSVFHFREFQSGKDGEIVDLGKIYYPSGDCGFDYNTTLVFGDLHSEDIDLNVFKCEKEILKLTNTKKSVLHDIASFSSISHHNENKFITQAIMAKNGECSLEQTIKTTANILKQICNINEEVIIVASNHHDHYMRWLEEGKFVQDKLNASYAVNDYLEVLNGEEIPLRSALKREMLPSDFNKLRWLGKNESCEQNGVECANHGNLSANGGRGNALRTYKKVFKKSVSAHAHAPERIGGAIRVGMSTKKFIGYNYGLSSWMPSVVIISGNGSTQTINIIEHNGEYTWTI